MAGELARKYPQVDTAEILSGALRSQEPVGEIEHNITFGGPEALRSVCKTAVNFYMLQGGSRDYIKHLIPYIKDGDQSSDINLYYPPEDIIEKIDGDVLHSIILVGDANERILYAYVELFSAVQHIVLLSRDYPYDTKETYFYNVLSGAEVNRRWDLHLSRQNMEEARLGSHFVIGKVEACIERLMSIILTKIDKEYRRGLITEAIKRVGDRYPQEAVITPAMVNEIVTEVMNALTPYLLRSYRRN